MADIAKTVSLRSKQRANFLSTHEVVSQVLISQEFRETEGVSGYAMQKNINCQNDSTALVTKKIQNIFLVLP